MNGFRLPRAACVGTLIAVALFAALGCSKKITRADPSFTMPEGRYSPSARLILYPDIEVNLLEYLDRAPVGPDPGDSLLGVIPIRLTSEGVIHGLVLDGTGATGYQALRRETGGGFLPLKDFLLHPAVRWLESHWEAYGFSDPSPSGFNPPTYLGRGLVSGVVNSTSPLTNEAEIAGAPTAPMSFSITSYPDDVNPTFGIQVSGSGIAPIRYSGVIQPADSLFRLSWGPVAGAAGYWVQVFQYRGAPTEDIIINGLPSPLAMASLVDFKVAYVAAPDTVYKIGTTPVDLLADKTILTSGLYRVRIVAVDANGRMIGFSFGRGDVAIGATTYIVYPLGAFAVVPKRPTPGSDHASPATYGRLSPASPIWSRLHRAR